MTPLLAEATLIKAWVQLWSKIKTKSLVIFAIMLDSFEDVNKLHRAHWKSFTVIETQDLLNTDVIYTDWIGI